MAAKASTPRRTTISDDAIRAATGKSRDHWFRVLDRLGADAHKARAAHLRTDHGLSPWWSQMVTVEFERTRGHRVRNQRSDGVFEVNVQRTVPTSAADAFDAWADAKRIGTWFSTKVRQDVRVGGSYTNGDGDRGTFLAVDAPRRLRFTWDNPDHAPGSIAEVTFLPAGRGRTAVRVTHTRLPSRREVEGLRRGWSWALTSLASYLATGRPIPYEAWVAEDPKARRPAASPPAPKRPRRAARPRRARAAAASR